jgi:hypothetical protein
LAGNQPQADSLRLPVEVGGHGAFVAAFGSRGDRPRSRQSSISEVRGSLTQVNLDPAANAPLLAPLLDIPLPQERTSTLAAPMSLAGKRVVRGKSEGHRDDVRSCGHL